MVICPIIGILKQMVSKSLTWKTIHGCWVFIQFNLTKALLRTVVDV